MEVVSIALETVRDFLIQEAIFISGVSSQVEEIQRELNRIQGFMKDIDGRQQKDDTIRNFANEFRQLAYRVEDVLETYTIKVQSHKEGHGFQNTLKRFSCKFREGIDLHKIGSEIEKIKPNLNNLISRMESHGIQEIVQNTSKEGQSSTQNQNWWRETYPQQVEEFFVGMKDDIRQLVSKITDERNNDEGYTSHRIISVYGMGGLGKTTIAKQIYKDIEVRRCFIAFAWVSVTQQFDRTTILRTILEQIVPNSNIINNMEERELIDELYKVQKEKKCLVVLDDLWEIDDWRCLNPAFPFTEANSKILVTTRNQILAEYMGGFPYSLPFLSKDEGWELLQKKAFSRESEIDPELEVIGREIVSRCGNLPLAISVIGGILSEKSSLPEEWQTVNKDVDFYLRMADSSKKEYGTVLKVLALSYDELPYYLKPCFLYLGHFDEDEEIYAPRLYEMWIAEGMVSPNHGGSEDTLTDVAERYLLEMSVRSMVQLKFREFSTRRTVETCRLHDLMRDFCLTRAKEVDFLEVLALKEGNIPSPDTSSLDRSKPSRYSILIQWAGERPSSDNYDNDAMINASLSSIDEPVRSLSVTNGSYPRLEISFPGEIYQSKKFKSLRVLGFESCGFKGKRLARGIKELIHLRYLSFQWCDGLTKLPSSIGQLQYLRTLRIDCASGELEVPNVLWKLKRLMFLYLPPYVKVKGKGKGRGKLCLSGLSKMETLDGFNSDFCEFGDLWEMINLRDFKANIYTREHETVDIVRPLLLYLNSNPHKLREATIQVYFDRNEVVPFDRNGVVPLKELLGISMVHTNHTWIIGNGKCEFQKLEPPYPCSNLVSLSFNNVDIEGDPMDCLGKLPNLKELYLRDVDLLDKVIVCGAHSFPQLEKLHFMFVRNFEDWIVFQGGLSKLSMLRIWNCAALKMIPDGLKFVVTLKELDITWMPPEFKQGVVDKFGHVPTIIYKD